MMNQYKNWWWTNTKTDDEPTQKSGANSIIEGRQCDYDTRNVSMDTSIMVQNRVQIALALMLKLKIYLVLGLGGCAILIQQSHYVSFEQMW
jgi:hypothetical protein